MNYYEIFVFGGFMLVVGFWLGAVMGRLLW